MKLIQFPRAHRSQIETLRAALALIERELEAPSLGAERVRALHQCAFEIETYIDLFG